VCLFPSLSLPCAFWAESGDLGLLGRPVSTLSLLQTPSPRLALGGTFLVPRLWMWFFLRGPEAQTVHSWRALIKS
jgi:hypothetical protein